MSSLIKPKFIEDFELEHLRDTFVPAPQDNELLEFDQVSGKWISSSRVDSELDQKIDKPGSPMEGDVLVYRSGVWSSESFEGNTVYREFFVGVTEATVVHNLSGIAGIHAFSGSIASQDVAKWKKDRWGVRSWGTGQVVSTYDEVPMAERILSEITPSSCKVTFLTAFTGLVVAVG